MSVVILTLLMGCAPIGGQRPVAKATERGPAVSSAHGDLPIWKLADLAQAGQSVVILQVPSGALIPFEAKRARLVQDVAERIAQAAGKGDVPQWLLIGTNSINAFATYQNGQPVIGITLGMLNLLKDDEGAWAALIGHELAHFRLGHHQTRQTRKESIDVGSSIAGLLLSAVGLGLGNIAADAAGTLAERSFSRDDEHDADRRGLNYVRLAGGDIQGALRLQERLLEAKQEAGFTFLSTHPSGQARVAAIRQIIEQQGTAQRGTSSAVHDK